MISSIEIFAFRALSARGYTESAQQIFEMNVDEKHSILIFNTEQMLTFRVFRVKICTAKYMIQHHFMNSQSSLHS